MLAELILIHFFTSSIIFLLIVVPITVYVYFTYSMPGIGIELLVLLAIIGLIFFTKALLLFAITGLLIFLGEKFY